MAKESAVVATTTPTPEPERQAFTLTDRQRGLKHLVDHHAGEEPRKIDSIQDLEPVDLLSVAKYEACYPERSYKWLAVDTAQSEIDMSRGLYVICNRANSSRFPSYCFDSATGGVIFSGQNVLAYTYRSNIEAIREKTIRDFDMSEKALKAQLNKTYHSPSGQAVVHVEESDRYTSGGYGADGPGSEPVELNKGETYDFESPS